MKRSRFFLAILFVCLAGFLAATPAVATQACGPGGCKQIDPPDPLSGGGGSPACQACNAGAYDRYNSTVKDSCQSFPVNLTPWTIAWCVQTAQSVLNQDLTNCLTDACS
jgi:hypothetical protein